MSSRLVRVTADKLRVFACLVDEDAQAYKRINQACQEFINNLSTQLRLESGEVIVASWRIAGKPRFVAKHSTLAIKDVYDLAYISYGIITCGCTNIQFYAAPESKAPNSSKGPTDFTTLFGCCGPK